MIQVAMGHDDIDICVMNFNYDFRIHEYTKEGSRGMLGMSQSSVSHNSMFSVPIQPQDLVVCHGPLLLPAAHQRLLSHKRET